jgi:hypothetical protein
MASKLITCNLIQVQALPSGLALDAKGNLYVSDFATNRVRRVDALSHTITTVAGNGKPCRSPKLRPTIGCAAVRHCDGDAFDEGQLSKEFETKLMQLGFGASAKTRKAVPTNTN